MEKQEYKITVAIEGGSDTKTVIGLTSKHFGIHKTDHCYTITHLLSGFRVYGYNKLKQCRKLIKLLEAEKTIDWNNMQDVINTQENRIKIKNLLLMV